MQPWQEKLLIDIESFGIKPGEMKIMMSGRGVGKSVVQAYSRLWEDLSKRPIEDIVLAERRVHGARFYTAEPIGGSWLEMETWAMDTYGGPGEFWSRHDFAWPECPRWFMNDRKFWFRNERDRTLFILRWSR